MKSRCFKTVEMLSLSAEELQGRSRVHAMKHAHKALQIGMSFSKLTEHSIFMQMFGPREFTAAGQVRCETCVFRRRVLLLILLAC